MTDSKRIMNDRLKNREEHTSPAPEDDDAFSEMSDELTPDDEPTPNDEPTSGDETSSDDSSEKDEMSCTSNPLCSHWLANGGIFLPHALLARITGPPSNADELSKMFAKRRSSLSDVDKIKCIHGTFIWDQAQASSKSDVAHSCFASLFNKTNATPMSCVAVNKPFAGLKDLPKHLDGPCAPGYAEGLAWSQVPENIRDELAEYIVPGPERPIASNFFLETAGPDDKAWALLNQISWDLFVGARAIQKLRQFAVTGPFPT